MKYAQEAIGTNINHKWSKVYGIKTSTFVTSDIDVLLSWITSAEQLRQWTGPTIFSWP